jgi:hypothetical protein
VNVLTVICESTCDSSSCVAMGADSAASADTHPTWTRRAFRLAAACLELLGDQQPLGT